MDAGASTGTDAAAPTVIDTGRRDAASRWRTTFIRDEYYGRCFCSRDGLTDLSGQATARVFVPYGGSEIVATISGGVRRSSSRSPRASRAVIIGTPQYTDPVVQTIGTGTGTQGIRYTLTTRITLMDGKTPIQALPVAFAQVGVSGSNNPFTPASTMTDATGHAVTNVFVPMLDPDAGVLSYVVTAGGASEVFTLP